MRKVTWSKSTGGRNAKASIVSIIVWGVMAVIVLPIFLALLLPAVQQAREAARRTKDGNQLKSIGIAMHNYPPEIYMTFPPSGVFAGPPPQSALFASTPLASTPQSQFDRSRVQELARIPDPSKIQSSQGNTPSLDQFASFDDYANALQELQPEPPPAATPPQGFVQTASLATPAFPNASAATTPLNSNLTGHHG